MAETTDNVPANDPQDTDGASTIGDSSTDDSLASLRSSILDYRRENGRTYHRVSDGKYYLPNDETEQDRLDFANHLWIITWDGKLCNCPKVKGAKRVLDVGTGTGIWALDYADAHPEASVIGVDLSPIQPVYVPPNCRFEIDDLEKEWTWTELFDFIFIRSMVGSFKSWPDAIKQAYDNLEPGGYLEIQDNEFPIFCDDGSMPADSQVLRWTQLIVEATDIVGKSMAVAPTFKQMLEDAGFEDVQGRQEKWPISPWQQKDPKQRELGICSRAGTMEGLEPICMALFTRVLGWTREEVFVFCAGVRDELKQQKVHGYFNAYAAWGRKPEKKEGEEEAS
ncbi:methyltransferase domain-containing protein [Colletotrichum abscissum]|uniref:methyltransferase domain-containing protein n=1 Tax=Colletotrichum abscissum TaxID=1671311 RepID=UPI0027D5D126|nr:methyltransferase domain-containing protein [Colletotrichum abscissum]KAK1490572.1 methyltransferase domain-containing protein [Colletotrichum abscissum]